MDAASSRWTMARPFYPTPLLLTLALFATGTIAAQPVPPKLGAPDREAIVSQVARDLEEGYVLAEVAQRMADRLRQRLEAGAYDPLDTVPALAEGLTADLQEVSHDLHLGVFLEFEPRPPEAVVMKRLAELARRENYCFRDVKNLVGVSAEGEEPTGRDAE